MEAAQKHCSGRSVLRDGIFWNTLFFWQQILAIFNPKHFVFLHKKLHKQLAVKRLLTQVHGNFFMKFMKVLSFVEFGQKVRKKSCGNSKSKKIIKGWINEVWKRREQNTQMEKPCGKGIQQLSVVICRSIQADSRSSAQTATVKRRSSHMSGQTAASLWALKLLQRGWRLGEPGYPC